MRRGGCFPILTLGIARFFSGGAWDEGGAGATGIGSWRRTAEPETSGSADLTVAVIVAAPAAVEDRIEAL
jgi:hypothetical protein